MKASHFSYDSELLGQALLKSFDKSFDELDFAFKELGIESDEEIVWLVRLFTLTTAYEFSQHLDSDYRNNEEIKKHILSNLDFQSKYNLPSDSKVLHQIINSNKVFHKSNKFLNDITLLLMAQLNRDIAAHSLLKQNYDEFIELYMIYNISYGAYVTEKKHVKMNHMKAKLIGSMAHKETNEIKKKIEQEYLIRKSQFKRYGYSAEFKREMARKYPEIIEPKTIERWISEFNDKNPEYPSRKLKGDSKKQSPFR